MADDSLLRAVAGLGDQDNSAAGFPGIYKINTGRRWKYCSLNQAGDRLVLAAPEGVELRDSETGELLQDWLLPPQLGNCLFTCHPASGRLALISVRQEIIVGDPETGENGWCRLEGREAGETGGYMFDHDIVFSPDGRYLAAWDWLDMIHLCRVDHVQPVLLWSRHLPDADKLAFSPDGKYLFACGITEMSVLRTWNGEKTALPEAVGRLTTFRADGRQLAVIGEEHKLNLHLTLRDWPSLVKRREISSRYTAMVLRANAKYSPDGNKLAVVLNSHVILWDLPSGRELAALTGWDAVIQPAVCEFTTDGKRLILGDDAGLLRIWDTDSGELLSQFSGHAHKVIFLAVVPDGSGFISADEAGFLCRWDLRQGCHFIDSSGHSSEIRRVALSGDGSEGASGDMQGVVLLWNTLTGHELARHEFADELPVKLLEFRPGSSDLLALSEKNLMVFAGRQRLLSGQAQETGSSNHYHTAAYSPDGRQLAVARDCHWYTFLIWHETAGLRRMHSEKAAAALGLTADGTDMVICYENGVTEIWQLHDELRPLRRWTESMVDNPRKYRTFAAISPSARYTAWWNQDDGFVVRDLSAADVSWELPQYSGGRVISVVFRSDNRQLAVGRKKTVMLYSLPHCDYIASFPLDSRPEVLAYSPNGELLAAALAGGTIWIWPVDYRYSRSRSRWARARKQEYGKPLALESGAATIEQLEFIADNRLLLVLDSNGSLTAWDLASQQKMALPGGLPDTSVGCIAVAGTWLAVAEGRDIYLACWTDDKPFRLLGRQDGRICHMSFTDCGQSLVSLDGLTVKVWPLADPGTLSHSFTVEESFSYSQWVVHPGVAAAGLAVSSYGALLDIYDTAEYSLQTSQLLRDTSSSTIDKLCFSADSRFLRIVNSEKRSAVWDINGGIWEGGSLQPVERLSYGLWAGETGTAQLRQDEILAVISLRLTDGRQEACLLPYLYSQAWQQNQSVLSAESAWALVRADDSREMAVWNTAWPEQADFTLQHSAEITCACSSADGCWAATGDSAGMVKVWNMKTKQEYFCFDRRVPKSTWNKGVSCLVFSPDAAWLAAGWRDGALEIWQLAERGLLHDLPGHEDSIYKLSVSPDGRQLLSGDFMGVYRLWETGQGQESAVLELPGSREYSFIQGIGWLPDGERLALTGDNQHICLICLRTGRVLAGWEMPNDLQLGRMAISPDGRILAISVGGGRVMLWDVRDGRKIATMKQAGGYVAFAFADNGCLLATGDSLGKLRIWDSSAGTLYRTYSLNSPILEVTAFSGLDGCLSVIVEQTGLRFGKFDGRDEVLRLAINGPAPERRAISAGNRHVALSFCDGRIIVWTPETGKADEFFASPEDSSSRWEYTLSCFSPDEKYLAVKREADGVWLWDETENRFAPLPKPEDAGGSFKVLGFTAANALYASSSKRTFLWDTDTLTVSAEFGGEFRSLAPDGKTALLLDREAGRLRLVDFAERRERWALKTRDFVPHAYFVWSEDASTLCLGHDNRRPYFINFVQHRCDETPPRLPEIQAVLAKCLGTMQKT